MSTPLNARVSSPTLFVGSIEMFDWPNTFGLMLCKFEIVWPAFGSRGSFGTVISFLVSVASP